MDMSYIPFIKNIATCLKNLIALEKKDVITDAAIRRIITKAGDDLDDLMLLYACSNTINSKRKRVIKEDNIKTILSKINDIRFNDKEKNTYNTLCIDGYMIKELFPDCTFTQIGVIKKQMSEAILDGRAVNTFVSLYPILLSSANNIGLVVDNDMQFGGLNTSNGLFRKSENINKCNYRIKYDDVCFTLYDDGSYIIEQFEDVSNDIENTIEVNGLSGYMLLQCYENGYVNKIPLTQVFNNRKDFKFKNGIYDDSSLQGIFIAAEGDFVLVRLSNGTGSKLAIIPVSYIYQHSQLGLKGYKVIKQARTLSWHILCESDKSNLSKILENENLPVEISLESKVYKYEVDWLNKMICNQK